MKQKSSYKNWFQRKLGFKTTKFSRLSRLGSPKMIFRTAETFSSATLQGFYAIKFPLCMGTFAHYNALARKNSAMMALLVKLAPDIRANHVLGRFLKPCFMFLVLRIICYFTILYIVRFSHFRSSPSNVLSLAQQRLVNCAARDFASFVARRISLVLRFEFY